MNRTIVIVILIIVGIILGCGLFLGGILIGTNFLNKPLSNLIPIASTPTFPPTNTEFVLPTATLAPTDTPLPTVAPTSTPTVTDTPLPTPTEIITNIVLAPAQWEDSGWNLVSSKECHLPKTQCWKSLYHDKVISLTWNDPVFIDPAWENPALVFWSWHTVGGHNWYGDVLPFGYFEIKPTNQPGWIRLGQVAGNMNWYRELKIDLNEYKSQEIYIRFYCTPVSMLTSYKDRILMPFTWIISDVSIVPNYIGP